MMIRRLGLRFACCYVVFFAFYGVCAAFSFPFYIGDLVVPWVGKNLVHISHDIATHPTGSGDRLYDWLWCVLSLFLSFSGAFVWTIVGRQRRDAFLSNWLRVIVRYELALIMLTYGFDKVFLRQFGYPGPDRLLHTYGNSSPMGLAWTFFGFSPPYQIFAGALELVGALLLYSRRTSSIGAFLLVGVLTNVVMVNVCYDVPVKLYSFHLLIGAIYIAAPDVRAIVDVVVLRRTVAPHPISPRYATGRGALVYRAAKTFAICASVFLVIHDTMGSPKHGPALQGVFDVQLVTPMAADFSANRIAINKDGLFVAFSNDEPVYYKLGEEGTHLTLTALPVPKQHPDELDYSLPAADKVVLVGSWDGRPVSITLTRVEPTHFRLTNRGFHWITERPYNR